MSFQSFMKFEVAAFATLTHFDSAIPSGISCKAGFSRGFFRHCLLEPQCRHLVESTDGVRDAVVHLVQRNRRRRRDAHRAAQRRR
jgi:hypothetical protein